MMSLSPGDVFETIAAEPDNKSAWVDRRHDLKRIAEKVSGLTRYACRPAYLLISASLFPRSVRSTGSFAVLTTPESIVDHSFDIGGFTAVFLHDLDNGSYCIEKHGRAVELQKRSLSTAVGNEH